MAKCIYCHKKKGKRRCPALNGTICSFCCGKHREKEIDCPFVCPFISCQQSYYVQKNKEYFHEYMVDLYGKAHKINNRIGLDLASLIDAELCRCFYNKPDVTDLEIVSLLDSLRRSLSPIQLVIQYEESALTRAVCKDVADYMDEVGLNDEDALNIVDSVISHIKAYAGSELNSNKYIKQLVNLLETKSPEMCRIIKDRYARKEGVIIPWSQPRDLEAGAEDEEMEGRKIIIP